MIARSSLSSISTLDFLEFLYIGNVCFVGRMYEIPPQLRLALAVVHTHDVCSLENRSQ